jgi:hypothetical protein
MAEVIRGAAESTGIFGAATNYLKAFDTAREMPGLMDTYYGLDLAAIPGSTPEELALLADLARQAKFFSDNIEVIEDHIKTYIQGIIDYNEFVARCVKAGVSGMKKIDKATLDTLLQLQSYKANVRKLSVDADVAVAKLNQETENYIALQNYDLAAAFRMMANKLAKEMAAIDAAPQEAEARAAAQMQWVLEARSAKQLIQYGSRAIGALPSTSTPSVSVPSTSASAPSSGGSWFKKTWGNIKNWFSGK